MKKLVGQGKPFHSAVDKAAGLLKRKVGTGAEFMKELMGITGIKPTEIQERGLNEVMGMPKMTHEQFMAALASKPAPAIEEKVLGEEPTPAEIIRRVNAHARASARGYAENADTLREAREMRADELRRLRENHRPQMIGYARRELADENAPFHSQYTLPGGENYREMLIKLPRSKQRETFKVVPQHFGGEPGILASMRLKDRTGPNGEKLLHLEELQSDWHQAGREQGYKSEENKKRLLATNDLIYDLDRRRYELLEKAKSMTTHGPEFIQLMDEANSLTPQIMQLNNDLLEYHKIDKSDIPDAPFKKNWEEMALKRLIHHAAEKGYHGIVVTPGMEQADRYSLAKHVNEISHNPRINMATGEKSKSVRIDMISGSPVQLGVANSGVIDNVSNPDHTNLIGKHLADVVGKDLAKNIMSEERGILSPQDLTVGGEGMKAFYDTKVPNILNSIGKKYGVKTQLHRHPIANPKKDLSITHMLAESGISEDQWQATPMDQRQAMVDQYEKDSKNRQALLHHFPITEEMRKDVLANGLPLYAGGGEVDAEEVFMGKGGKVKEPKSTVKAYKLFRVDERHPGKLFPLFVNANQPVEMNKWVNAEVGPQTDKGKVKSKLGPLAYRPGWHSGDLPVATHIGEGGAPPTHRPRNHAWAEVEVPNDVDWQTEANKRGINKQGKLIAREAHITDQIPKGGHYRYKTNPNMTGNWLISGSMKVNKVLSHPEVERINKKAGVSDLPRKEPFNKKDFGFKYGGDVDVESYFFPNKE